ncbi:MAG: hypothetical protein JW891_18285 [Candidatus Lokiarchaeota archaeon]|nr:hypothetical protein [Candidatus Lokiarchaeota archaeon]
MRLNKKVIGSLFVLIFLASMLPSIAVAVADTSDKQLQTSASPSIKIVSSPDWARHEIVWNTGYWQTITSGLKPWDANAAFGIALIYETLFGYDQINKTMIPCIGTNMSWSASGDMLTVDINPKARWSDGVHITSSDVKYSFELAADQPRWEDDMDARIDYITEDSDYRVSFHMVAGYEYSTRMEEFITQDIPVVPEHVWRQIVEQEDDRDLSTFTNYWFDSDFPIDWMVCSGPYAPHYVNPTGNQEVYMYRDDWWGAGEIYLDLPALAENDTTKPPKFVGKIEYSDNNAQDAALKSGTIDCFSGYYANVWELMAENDNIGTFFGKDHSQGEAGEYFLALSSVLTISPNHLIYPLNEIWFREAIAYCINYDRIPSHAASNYTRRAKQGFIDGASPSQEILYNQTVQDMYGIDYNLSHAEWIMDQYCSRASITDPWTIDATGVEISQAGLRTANGDPTLELTIINPSGWTDTALTCDYWAEDISALLDVSITHLDVNFGNDYIPDIEADDFFMAMQTAGPKQTDTTFRLLGSLRGTSLWNQNSSNWQSTAYEALYEALETETDVNTQKAIASEMQKILATEFPEIPSHNNGYWYLYSDKFWNGFLSEDNMYNQMTSVFIVNEMAIKARLYLNLRATGVTVPPAGETGLWIIIGVGVTLAVVIAAAGAYLFLRRRKAA